MTYKIRKKVVRVFAFWMCTVLAGVTLKAQDQAEIDTESDAFFIKALFDEALETRNTYTILSNLIESSGGHRLSGTENYDKAVDFVSERLTEMGFEDIERIPSEVTRWKRGKNNEVVYVSPFGEKTALPAVALGGSGSSGGKMIYGEVVAFNHIDSVETYKGDLRGKIAFFTRPFDQTLLNPFRAYSGAAAQRVFGPTRAAEKGAIATVVRSMSSALDDHPHTGVTIFENGAEPIPAMAISTIAAEKLQRAMKEEKVQLGIRCNAKTLDPVIQHSVVGEIRGSVYPDEIILAGGHLDSWDVGVGAHDDGSGCAHVMEAFRLLIESGYEPQRTWRCVLFANEENGLAGAKSYAEWSNARGEFHLAAIESDAGGFSPRSFSFDADTMLKSYMQAVNRFWPLLEPYHMFREFTGSGADVNSLKSQGGLLIGFRPDPQRYFDYHHSTNDNLEHVNPRELSMGAAVIAAMIYLIDKYGLEAP